MLIVHWNTKTVFNVWLKIRQVYVNHKFVLKLFTWRYPNLNKLGHLEVRFRLSNYDAEG